MGFMTTWAVDGSKTPAVVARVGTYAGTSGAHGVVEPDHLKVIPLGGLTVGLQVGAALVSAGDTGTYRFQTYAIAVNSTDDDATVTVSGPSSQGRTIRIVAVVPDPERAGVPIPDSPLTAAYAEARALTSSQESALTIPHYRLATIVIPADAAVITDTMIDDEREVAQPKSIRSLYTYDLTTPQADTLTSDPAGESWPDVGGFQVKVPRWATKANIKADFGQVEIPAGSTRAGFLTVMLGSSFPTAGARFQAPGASGATRQSYVAAGDANIPNSMRGETIYVYTRGVVNGGSGGGLLLDSNSSLTLDIEFLAVAR